MRQELHGKGMPTGEDQNSFASCAFLGFGDPELLSRADSRRGSNRTRRITGGVILVSFCWEEVLASPVLLAGELAYCLV